MKLVIELTVRSNYKPQKVTTLRMSQALSFFKGKTQRRCHPTSVHVLSLNLNSSALWNPRHWSASSTRTKSFQAFLRSSIKSIHFFRLLSLCGHVVPKKGILCMLIPFASSLMFPHLAATHLSGIFEKRAEIPRLVFSEIQRKAEVTCSWIYVTALAKPRGD